MFQANQLQKSYGAATILADITFIINPGEHIGLIGPNGAGKSTLLRILAGQDQPDRGSLARTPPNLAVGYLPQSFGEQADETVGAVLAAAQAELVAAEAALNDAATALADAADADGAMRSYDDALTAFEALGGYERTYRTAAVLEGLALTAISPDRPLSTLSGGQKTRLGLATLLLQEPDMLLLDEPTNHLDSAALAWLEGWVREYPKAVLVVSHDRAFLDATVTRVLYLDGESRTLRSYTGNYSDFVAAREHERELHEENWQKQQEYVGKVESDIARLKGQALGVELSTTPAQPTVRRYAKKVAKKAKSRERKLERYLDSDERVEKPRNSWGLKLDFGEPPEGGRAVLQLEDVSFGYPGAEPLLKGASAELAYGERVAILGPNGTGKSTLLKLIAGTLQPTAGLVRVGASVRLGVLAQEHETLDLRRSVLDTVRAVRPMSETDARNLLHQFLFGGDSVFRPVGACSLGERSRLQLAVLVLQGCNLLLLDEPLNHLDIGGREHFAEALEAFAGTALVVSHDRAFVREYAERVLALEDGRLRPFADYAGYERWSLRPGVLG